MLRITTILALLSLSVAAAADDVSARRAVLLNELAQCLSALPKDVEYFDSPCAEKNVEPLAGGSEQEVVGKLGAPQFCILATGDMHQWSDAGCLTASKLGYSFYVLKGVGGGPELILSVGTDKLIQSASWMHTQ